jgi:hypothetical protein
MGNGQLLAEMGNGQLSSPTQSKINEAFAIGNRPNSVWPCRTDLYRRAMPAADREHGLLEAGRGAFE